MKVLHVIGIHPLPPLGGMEMIVVNLAREQAMRGHAVRVLSPSMKRIDEKVDGVEYRALPSGILRTWIQFPRPASLREMRGQVAWADLVHIHNPPELFNLLAFAMARRARKPIALSLFSPGALRTHPQRLFRWGGRWIDAVLLWQMRRAAIVHVANLHDQEFARSRGIPAELVPDGLQQRVLEAPPQGEKFKREEHLEDARPILLYLGRVNRFKGPDHLVEAVGLLVSEYPRLVALIVGPDSDGMFAELRASISRLGLQDHVRLTGPKDLEAKLPALDAADVVVIPSVADFVEGFSLTASEGWARHKPVVGYPIGALKVRIRDGVDGTLAKSVDPAALAEAIRRAVRLPPVALPPSDVIGWREATDRLMQLYDHAIQGADRS